MNSEPAIAFFPYRPGAWIRVSGLDAAGFLQGQFTNDVDSLRPAQAVYGLWLDHKGRVGADGFVGRKDENEFWIASYFCPGEALRQRLESFIIADDVVLEDQTSAVAGLAVLGAGSRSFLPATPPSGVVFSGRRGAGEAWEWIFPAAEAAAAAAMLAGRREVTAAEMELRRIAAGVPAVPRDLGPGDLPNEGGLAEAAISYTKGCYIGQEVMARLKTRGRLRRQLRRVRGSGAPPALPAGLWDEHRLAGELRSACPDPGAGGDGFSGLAMLNLTPGRGAAPLSFSSGGPAVVTSA